MHAKHVEQRRGTATQRGYTYRWSQYSRAVRDGQRWRDDEGLPTGWCCGDRPAGARQTTDSVCRQEGRVTRAAVVDHIVPITGKDDPRFFVATEHQTLCEVCHNSKRQREAGP